MKAQRQKSTSLLHWVTENFRRDMIFVLGLAVLVEFSRPTEKDEEKNGHLIRVDS